MTRRTLVWRIKRLLPLATLLVGCDQLPGAPLQSIPTFQTSSARTEAAAEPALVGPARRREVVAAGATPPAPAAPAPQPAPPAPGAPARQYGHRRRVTANLAQFDRGNSQSRAGFPARIHQ